jgi:hypothetical protein
MERKFGVQIVHKGRRGVHIAPQEEYLIGASYLIKRTRNTRLLKHFKDKYSDVEYHEDFIKLKSVRIFVDFVNSLNIKGIMKENKRKIKKAGIR